MFITENLKQESIGWLKELISTPSYSREESGTAALLERILTMRQVSWQGKGHNIWAVNRNWKSHLPVILLNSHHDTVRPVRGWTRDPFDPAVEDGRLFGLGSNDAGASLVALLAVFLRLYHRTDLSFNLIFLASAEEEISGSNGVESVLPDLGPIYAGIVGEPTQMQMAVAEKGLLVIDALAKGLSGHAARKEGVNAIYKAMNDISIVQNLKLDRRSPWLGDVQASVTQINGGTQHNVTPDECHFVIDVRTNECYTNQEMFGILQERLTSALTARSFRLNSTRIHPDHPLVLCGKQLGLSCFGSPTLSDQALMSFPTLKIGPGDSARSHTADEFISLEEIESGIDTYQALLEQLNHHLSKSHATAS